MQLVLRVFCSVFLYLVAFCVYYVLGFRCLFEGLAPECKANAKRSVFLRSGFPTKTKTAQGLDTTNFLAAKGKRKEYTAYAQIRSL